MKSLISLIILAVLIVVLEAKIGQYSYKTHPTWRLHTNKFKIKFNNEEEEIKAFHNYDVNDDLIKNHNNNDSNSYQLGHNEFSHWSKKDHQSKHMGLIETESKSLKKRDVLPGKIYYTGRNHTFQYYGQTAGYSLPASVDWVKSGWNTTVRNQQQCGDCWAFATTASIEALYWKNKSVSVTLSPQQLTDCSFSYGNNGCNGGVVAYAYGYVNDVGLVQDQYYTFINNQSTCKFSSVQSSPLYKVKGYYKVSTGNDSALMEALAKFGPIPVGVNASAPGFGLYKSGIFANTAGSCAPSTNHAVLLTGYGVDVSGNKYWTIKNQWGTTWGNKGYMNISRNFVNNCGISSQAFIPYL